MDNNLVYLLIKTEIALKVRAYACQELSISVLIFLPGHYDMTEIQVLKVKMLFLGLFGALNSIAVFVH